MPKYFNISSSFGSDNCKLLTNSDGGCGVSIIASLKLASNQPVLGVGIEEEVTELICPIDNSFTITKHPCFNEFNGSRLCLDWRDVSPRLLTHYSIDCFLTDITYDGIVLYAVDTNIIKEGVVNGKDSRLLGFGET